MPYDPKDAMTDSLFNEVNGCRKDKEELLKDICQGPFLQKWINLNTQ